MTLLHVAAARLSSYGSAVRYVLPVLCFHVIQGIVQKQRRRMYFVQFARWRHRYEVCRYVFPDCILFHYMIFVHRTTTTHNHFEALDKVLYPMYLPAACL